MSLSFKFVPLTFISDEEEIKKQIRNTIILRYFFNKHGSTIELNDMIIGTQYGYNASALESGRNKFLRISDITDGKVDWQTVPFCDCKDEETYLLKKNDILIARTGGTTGKSFLITNAPDKAVYAGYLIRIRANDSAIPEFLDLFLNSYAYWSQIMSLNKGEFRPSVNANKLKKLVLPNCSDNEQRDAIELSNGKRVDGYEQLHEKIRLSIEQYDSCKEVSRHLELNKETTQLLKQSILQEAIQGKLTEDWRKQNPEVEHASTLLDRIKAEKDQLVKEKKIKKEKALPSITKDEIPFELPEGWMWCYFRDVAKFQIGKTPASKRSEYWNQGEINWLSISDMIDSGEVHKTKKKITLKAQNDTFNNHSLVPIDTLLMSFKLTVGKISINKIPLYHNEAIISIFPFDGASQSFLFNLLPTVTQFNASKTVLMGQTFNSNSLAKMLFPLPPYDEQLALVKKIETLLNKQRALEHEIEKSEVYANQLMQAVLKKAFE